MGVVTPAPASNDTMAAMSRRLLAPGTVARRRSRVRTSVAPALAMVRLVYARSPCAAAVAVCSCGVMLCQQQLGALHPSGRRAGAGVHSSNGAVSAGAGPSARPARGQQPQPRGTFPEGALRQRTLSTPRRHQHSRTRHAARSRRRALCTLSVRTAILPPPRHRPARRSAGQSAAPGAAKQGRALSTQRPRWTSSSAPRARAGAGRSSERATSRSGCGEVRYRKRPSARKRRYR